MFESLSKELDNSNSNVDSKESMYERVLKDIQQGGVYDEEQVEELELGINDGLYISKYSNPIGKGHYFSADEMEIERLKLMKAK